MTPTLSPAQERERGGPAFPVLDTGPDYYPNFRPGMSLRDWFAGQALQGMAVTLIREKVFDQKEVARWAYGYADAMLAARLTQEESQS